LRGKYARQVKGLAAKRAMRKIEEKAWEGNQCSFGRAFKKAHFTKREGPYYRRNTRRIKEDMFEGAGGVSENCRGALKLFSEETKPSHLQGQFRVANNDIVEVWGGKTILPR